MEKAIIEEVKEDLLHISKDMDIRLFESMAKHTSFRIGGPASIYVEPASLEEIRACIAYFRKKGIEYLVMGNASNILVTDKGYEGAIICLGKKFSAYELKGNEIEAEAGLLLSRLVNISIENSLKGLVFASGIPGSFGGGIFMNAGAYGGEMKDVLKLVKALDPDGNLLTLERDDLGLAYRKSVFQENKMIILSAIVELEVGNKEELLKEARELRDRRNLKQPLNYPSAGSFFKRPRGHYAGKLIMESGLAGYRIGGAEVSSKHCGFIINSNKASFEDVYRLSEYVKDQVFKKFGVELEREVRIIGIR